MQPVLVFCQENSEWDRGVECEKTENVQSIEKVLLGKTDSLVLINSPKSYINS